MKTDGLILDLDGTLWDASEACIMAWNKTFEEFGFPSFQVDAKMVAGFSGRLLKDILTENLSFIPPDQHCRFIEIYSVQESTQMQAIKGKLYPGVKKTLDNLLNKYPLFIVSNCQQGYIETFLEQNALQSYFRDFECSGNTGNSKTDNIRDIISRNQLLLPAYIGDTAGDYAASQRNHIPFIYASYGFGVVSSAKIRIDQFSNLLDLLEPLDK